MSLQKDGPFIIAFAAASLSLLATANAATVWSSGPGDLTFNKSSWDGIAGHAGDPALPLNQDRITASVQLTRGLTKALYNSNMEAAFNDSVDPAISPADTEWAFSGLSGNPTFAYGTGAAMYGSLSFDYFENSLGGSHALRSNILSSAGVVHLITADIYMDIMFSNWQAAGGGSFTYTRTTESVPEPATFGTFALGIGVMWRFHRSSAR